MGEQEWSEVAWKAACAQRDEYVRMLRKHMQLHFDFDESIEALYEKYGWDVTLTVLYASPTDKLEDLWDELKTIAVEHLRDRLLETEDE